MSPADLATQVQALGCTDVILTPSAVIVRMTTAGNILRDTFGEPIRGYVTPWRPADPGYIDRVCVWEIEGVLLVVTERRPNG